MILELGTFSLSNIVVVVVVGGGVWHIIQPHPTTTPNLKDDFWT